jgi:hypothetical protein
MDTHIRVDRRFAIIDEWVLDLDISDRALRLYAILMRYADKDTHKAFPSRKTLAGRLRCSAASVDRASMELIEAGLLSKEQRHNNSLVYTLHSSPVQTPIITHDDTLSSPVMTAIVTGDDLTRTTELEPNEQEPVNYMGEFDQFWQTYPKKADKAVARRAFEKALKRTTLDVILAGVERYRDDPNRDPEYTKNPSTWLNADAWENEPLPVKSANIPTPGPGKREWVKDMHMMDEHWACEPGEFGCK